VPRRVGVLVALLALAACSPGVAETGPKPTSPPSFTPPSHIAEGRFPVLRREPTRDHPLRLLFVGDSIGLTLLPTVAVASEQLGVRWHDATQMGFGFTADHPARFAGVVDTAFPDWRAHVRGLLDEVDPDVVLVEVGAWDIVDRLVDGSWLRPGTARWREWYDRLLDHVAADLTRRGARLTFLAMPCVDTEYGPRVRSVNAAFRALAARHPDRTGFVDLHERVCPAGRYTASLPDADGKPTVIRQPDGVHFVMFQTAPVLADWLAEQLAADWRGG
jgi:hypothetical protein